MPVAGPDKDSKSADSRPARVASPEQVFAHLETVLASPVFRTSKRCQKLLRFVVENTALGRVDLLKERTIGIEVFSRPPHYEPSEDAIVRVNANEVRKRLAQYYLSAGRQGVWFELPAGSYVPEFHFGPPAETEAAPEPLEPPPPARRVFFERRLRTWLAAAGVLAAAGTFGAVLFFQAEAPLEEFWAPMWAADIPPLVSLPIGSATLISPRLQGELTRQSPPFSKPVLAGPGEIEILPEQAVGRHTVSAILDLAMFIQRHGRTPEIRFGSQLNLEDLRSRPVVLIGAFNYPWTLDLNRQIRFVFERQDEPNQAIFAIQDRKDPDRRWRVYGQPRFGYDSPEVDYAIVTRIFEGSAPWPLISAAGVTQLGTRAALEFITNPVYWEELSRTAPRDWKRRNLQVVLQTNVVGRTPKPPRVLASHFW